MFIGHILDRILVLLAKSLLFYFINKDLRTREKKKDKKSTWSARDGGTHI